MLGKAPSALVLPTPAVVSKAVPGGQERGAESSRNSRQWEPERVQKEKEGKETSRQWPSWRWRSCVGRWGDTDRELCAGPWAGGGQGGSVTSPGRGFPGLVLPHLPSLGPEASPSIPQTPCIPILARREPTLMENRSPSSTEIQTMMWEAARRAREDL